jgi:hypothetical protein
MVILKKGSDPGSDPEPDPKLLENQAGFGSGSKTLRKVGAGSPKNSFGSTTLFPTEEIPEAKFSFILNW